MAERKRLFRLETSDLFKGDMETNGTLSLVHGTTCSDLLSHSEQSSRAGERKGDGQEWKSMDD